MRKRKAGDKHYKYGFQLVLPMGHGEMEQITFTGEFDHRQLRKMVRKVVTVPLKTEEIDYLCREYGTRLRPMTNDEMAALANA